MRRTAALRRRAAAGDPVFNYVNLKDGRRLSIDAIPQPPPRDWKEDGT